MDLYEYQAKDLLAAHGVPVVAGSVINDPTKAAAVAAQLGGRVVVKAQVKTGGRGKAGGVKLAADPADAVSKAAQILGMDIKGHTVHKVLVAAACQVVEEYYVSFLLDRSNRTFLAMASIQGGMDIEEVAATKPEALARIPVSAGVDLGKAREIVAAARFPAEVAEEVAEVLVKLWECFVAEDATLLEINPLGRDGDGHIVALDSKITLDDNAAYRHPAQEDSAVVDPLEAKAKALDLNYVKLDGQVGVIGNGAGLVMSTLDVVAYAGVKPANFLDIGGGASAEVMANGLSVILGDPDVRAAFSSTFSAAGSPPVTRSRTELFRRWRFSVRRRPNRWSYGWTGTTWCRAGGSSRRRTIRW